ncbi:SDR family NAD(P)-dependent oxidoreductase [Enterococcus casseliflavus]|uniref:SDR family NAD(P)-dependent oxidoreductase n=1 Tax=Enterococcus casseliflavus TaxID=37734 RepID=UPI00191A7E7D|nr:SDR family oxidoreductase [Enterococcus casseliflavus]MDV7712271.1 SDR family NAD(P)-dependent oxidoreductase [Enterococcus casseliflavus]QQU15540.1 SDR family oxidoreductase [Enterococcus casseliflavus]
MKIKKYIKRVAKFILTENSNVVNLKISQIYTGKIHKDKVFLITGGSKGIGYEIAKKITAEGGKVIITGRNYESLTEARKKLKNSIEIIEFDNKNFKEYDNLIEKANSFYGNVDFLICNAGISNHESSFFNVTEKSWNDTFDINLKANFFLAKHFLENKVKLESFYGGILFISSETANQNYDIPYGLTKAALNSLTGALASRMSKQDFRINAIAPGVTATDMTSDYTDIEDGNFAFNSSAGRIFIPEEVAEVANFLLSDASKCISGEIIHTNRGNHLNPWWEKRVID